MIEDFTRSKTMSKNLLRMETRRRIALDPDYSYESSSEEDREQLVTDSS